MTTTRAVARTAVAPALLLAGATTFLLTNDTPSPEVARSAAGTVADWPAWARATVELVSEGGLLVLAVLLGLAAWHTRPRGSRSVATALAGAAGVGLALVASETLKAAVAQDRPCRAVPGLQAVVDCPPVGDWSLPSNHATLAAALATAVIWAVPRWSPAALGCALLVAAARVGLGVHYPHDVVDGLVLGALVGSAAVLLLRRPMTGLVSAFASISILGPLSAPTKDRGAGGAPAEGAGRRRDRGAGRR